MSGRHFQQYFGPSLRHGRACVEMHFPLGERTHNLAPLQPMLERLGFELATPLPDEPLPLDAAVCRLAGSILARHKPWWIRHGADGEFGWVATAFPVPIKGAAIVEGAYLLATRGEALPPVSRAVLRELAYWLAKLSKIRMWMPAVAATFGREAATLVEQAETYQVGQGVKGVQFFRLGSQRDSLTGQMFENNKHAAAHMLRRLGLPATDPVLVRKIEEAAAAIAHVGLPCVVKPMALAKGMGVAAGLESEAAALVAVSDVLAMTDLPALVERHVPGEEYRMMVVAGELLWAYRKVPARIVGDGEATIGELIERENRRRQAIRAGTDAYLYPIIVDDGLQRFLADRHGLALDAVLEAGRSIAVTSQANISRGASIEDVTGQVHPDNRALMLRIARLFRLQSIGVDFITDDIARSWTEVPATVIEINSKPGISGYGDATLVHRTLFPNRRSGMIPTVAVIGSEDFCATAARAIETAASGCGVRLATAAYPGAGHTQPRLSASPVAHAVETLMFDPDAEAILLLCDPAAVEAAGFPLRHCDLLVVQDRARFDWLVKHVDAISGGEALDETVEELVRRYADPAEGGALPVLEPIEGDAHDVFQLKVWRARAMPRTWFWAQVAAGGAPGVGLTTHADLLAAVAALAAPDGSGPFGTFSHGELPGSWARTTFAATIALPERGRSAARAALLAAVERVNAIASARIG